MWAACTGGAAQRVDYLAMIGAAGFEVETVRENDYRFVSDRAVGETATYGVSSVSLLAVKRRLVVIEMPEGEAVALPP